MIHYFLTGLKPLDIKNPPKLRAEDYLARARDCLSEKIVNDLEKLAGVYFLDQAIRELLHAKVSGKSFSIRTTKSFQIIDEYHDKVYLKRLQSENPQVLRRICWEMIAKDCRSKFLKKFAQEAVNLYEVVAAMLAKENKLLKNLYQRELSGPLDSTAKMIINNFEKNDFSLTSRHKFISELSRGLADKDPMVLEKIIADHLFMVVDEYAHADPFSNDQVFSYFIKLTICERFQSFSKESGQAILNKLVESVREGALSE